MNKRTICCAYVTLLCSHYFRVMSQLERIWECELESFNAVEKLAQCLDQRGRTWQRLKHLQKQVTLFFPYADIVIIVIFIVTANCVRSSFTVLYHFFVGAIDGGANQARSLRYRILVILQWGFQLQETPKYVKYLYKNVNICDCLVFNSVFFVRRILDTSF